MNREREIFDAALDLRTPEERSAYIRGACQDDDEMQLVVEELLEAHFDAGDFLPTQPGDIASLSEGEGSVIGRYKILQKIGEGGFGIVYMAEQREPVRRRVALKIIKLGMDTKQVIARFEAERQALALMDHPNIARILDGGTTEDGRSFFVMDLVRGLPIVEYCDSQKLPASKRLSLFVDVCNAVQHAHHKGIIHRDLKPSNVLVASHDGRPVPMIIDFGIAKALQQPLTEHTLFTGFNQMIGTPAYMSPEQAEMNALDVDTRADIYTLGILLYELLTGAPPVDPKRLRSAGFGEIQRIIREEEAEKPSTRLRTLDDEIRTRIAGQRQIDPVRLGRALKGELDWIVLKALEKDRSRRYKTAGALGDDIQRHLEGETVDACPPTRLYRFQKFVSKHRLPFGVVSLVAVALLLGVIMAIWQAMRAARAEQAAVDQLWNSYLVQAGATRSTGQPVQRFESIATISKAAKIKPSFALRNEAVAALALPDMRLLHLVDEPEARESPYGALVDPERGRHAWFDQEGDVHIVGSDTGKELAYLPGQPTGSDWARFSNSGKFLSVSAMNNRSAMKVWDLDRSETVLDFDDCSHAVVSFSLDDKSLAMVEGKYLLIYDLQSGTRRRIDCGFHIRNASWSIDSLRLAVLSNSDQIAILELESGKIIRTLKHSEHLMSASWHPNGKLLATGSRGFGIQIWNLEKGEIIKEFHGHESEVTTLEFHPGGRFLFSSGWDGQTRVWDVHRGVGVLRMSGTFERLNARGDRIAFRHNSKGAGIWEFSPNTPSIQRYHLEGAFSEKLSSLTVSRDNRWLATSRSSVDLWNLRNGELEARIPESGAPRDTAFATNGTDLFVGGGVGLKRYEIRSTIQEDGKSALEFREKSELLSGRIDRFGLSPDGTEIAAIKGRKVHVISSESGERQALLSGQTGIEHGDIIYSHDNLWMLGTSWAGRGVRIWDRRDLDLKPVNLLENQKVVTAEFSPDGKWLLTSTRRKYQFWETGSWKEKEERKFARSAVGGFGVMAFSPDGKMLAVSPGGQKVELRDFATHELLIILRPPEPASLVRLRFSPDGSKIFATNIAHDVVVWDLPKLRKELMTMGLDWLFGPHVLFPHLWLNSSMAPPTIGGSPVSLAIVNVTWIPQFVFIRFGIFRAP